MPLAEHSAIISAGDDSDERAGDAVAEPLARVAALSRALREAAGVTAVVATALVHISAALGHADVSLDLCDELAGGPSFQQPAAHSGPVVVDAPLTAAGHCLGTLRLSRAAVLSAGESRALAMAADLVAGALYRTMLEERLARSAAAITDAYEASIDAWARALDMREHNGGDHSRRLAWAAVRIGSELGLSEADLINLRRGALLHDIGKMGVPDAILQKRGPLTEAEWAIIRQHPLHAGDLLAPIGFLQAALAAPRYHHERWDGRGYPFGLSGEQIPLAARIVAVADAWDAMTSDRPYRAALSHEAALAQLVAGSGSAYDPRVVAAFLRVLDAADRRAAA